MQDIRRMKSRCMAATVLLFGSTQLSAMTPAEMAELSLQDLMGLKAESESRVSTGDTASRWQARVQYSQLRFDGYQSGDSKLDDERVLFRPGTQARTSENYPVLPTTIVQEAVTLAVSYQLNNGDYVDVAVPTIKQSTHHKSIVPGYGRFIIDSEGLGDISISYNHLWRQTDTGDIRLIAGISAPTGSIDKAGDTPRAAGDQQLPYTMQLGSGTWDLPLGINWSARPSEWSYGLRAHAILRTGKNDRDYRLGHRLQVSGLMRSHHHNWISPYAKLSAHYAGGISGQDDEITVPGAYPYPASITDPDNFGSKGFNVALGAEFGGMTTIELAMPLYEYRSGIQIRKTLQFTATWKAPF